jgi:D-lactate dehydrogenase
MKAAFFEITEEWQKQILSQALSEHKISFINTSLDESAQAPKDAEILGVFINSRITKGVMDKMPNLKLIVTLSTGFDHIDVNEAKKRGISVCNVPSYGENTVAEFTMALILTLSRRIYPAIKRVHEEGKFSYEGLRGFDLKGKKIGVVGTGKIGARLIKIAQGFEMEILAYDPHPREDLEVSYLPLNDLLSQADVVTIHVPYMPDTHHLLNINNLKLIKPSAILINTSRGGLVDTMALLTALKNGQLAGAAAI